MTASDSTHTAARIGQRRRPAVTKSTKIMLRQSSHRHGNCMNSIFGRILHSSDEKRNISRLQAIAQPANATHSSRVVSRHCLAATALAATMIISRSAIHEMILLKAS